MGVPRNYPIRKTKYWDLIPIERVEKGVLVFNPDHPLAFTGGLLIGRNILGKYRFVPPAYIFDAVFELVFEQGVLVLEADRSVEMREVRALQQEQQQEETRDKEKVQQTQVTPSTFTQQTQADYERLFSETTEIPKESADKQRWNTCFRLTYPYW